MRRAGDGPLILNFMFYECFMTITMWKLLVEKVDASKKEHFTILLINPMSNQKGFSKSCTSTFTGGENVS